MLKLMPRPTPELRARRTLPPWALAVVQLPIVGALAALLLRGDQAPEPPHRAIEATGIRYTVSAEEWPQGTTLRFLADRYGGDLAAMRSLNPPGAGCADSNARIEPGDVVTIAFSAENVECDDGDPAPSPATNGDPGRAGSDSQR